MGIPLSVDEIAKNIKIKGEAYEECKKRRDILRLRLKLAEELAISNDNIELVESLKKELALTEDELNTLRERLYDINV